MALEGFKMLVPFVFSGQKLLSHLDPRIVDPDLLESELIRAGGKDVSIPVARKHVNEYNRQYLQLRVKLPELRTERPFSQTMTMLFCIRALAVAVSLYSAMSPVPLRDGWLIALLISAAQFAVAPYSLLVSFHTLVALSTKMFIPHAVVHGVLSPLLAGAFGAGPTLVINSTFVWLFFAIDMLLCAGCLFYIPFVGKVKPKPFRGIMNSVAFGFINCKTFDMVLLTLCCASELRVCLWIWALDACFGLSARVGDCLTKVFHWPHWAALFYHEHRIAHLPHIYQHAHKFHHFLVGSTAFDAHLYGNGMPEEYAVLALELAMSCGLGLLPPTLNPHVLYLSWTNKVGHADKAEGHVDGSNAHQEHHLFHHKNFGIFSMTLDLLMGTASQPHRYPTTHGYTVLRDDSDVDNIVMRFSTTPQ